MGVDQARWLRIQEIEKEGHSLGGRGGSGERGRQANESVRAGCSFLISAAGLKAASPVACQWWTRRLQRGQEHWSLLPTVAVLPAGFRGTARHCGYGCWLSLRLGGPVAG